MSAESKPLRLAVEDAADLEIVSAALQDAAVKVGEIAYDAKSWRFAALVNRYRWEAAPVDPSSPGHRVRALLLFDHVVGVRSLNLKRDEQFAVASILALRFEPDPEPPSGRVRIVLAGGGEIELRVEALQARLTDTTEPWRAKRRPQHGDA